MRFQPRRQQRDADQQQDAVEDRRELGPGPGVDVRRSWRTMTEVIGSPPMRPDDHVPNPCQAVPGLGGEVRRRGSSLSTASRFRSVSREATAAIVTAAMYTAGFDQLGEIRDLAGSPA